MKRNKYLIKESYNYIQENKRYFYQNKNLILNLFLLISLILIFPYSLCETNNKVVLEMPGVKSAGTVKVIHVTNEVESMKVNDEIVNVNQKVKSIVGDGYEVTIYFQTPLYY